MSEGKNCRECNFWKPRYHGVGTCEREGRANAKMWVTEGRELLTVGSFACSEFQPQSNPREEIA
jgi:hypothetical protein